MCSTDPTISIIVPVYKVEKYLKRCVDSILSQTYTDFECILVDDGSPDKCGYICDEYAEKDQRIRVIHKKNGGLSDARNVGIDAASGEYLSFIDSDDWIHPKMLEILYDGITHNDVLMSICAYKRTDDYETFNKIKEYRFTVRDGMDFLARANSFPRATYSTAIVAWNKLYHKSLFKDIRYPYGRIHEDEFTTYKLLYKSGDIAYCDEMLYCYFRNNEGIMKSKYTTKRMDVLAAWEERNRFFKKHKLKKYYEWCILGLLYGYVENYNKMKGGAEYKKHARIIKRKIRYTLIYILLFSRIKGNKIDISIYRLAFPNMVGIYYFFKYRLVSRREYNEK